MAKISNIPTSRLEGLTDAIFGVAMTILVLSIEVPTPGTLGIDGINVYLLKLIPTLSIYAISFLLLGCFWIAHHSFFLINKIDEFLLWINILWLMAICLIPFSVSLVSSYGASIIANLFFASNMIIIGILYFFNIAYAYKKGFFIKDLNFNLRILIGFSIFIILISIIDIVISFINPVYNKFFYLLIPLFTFLSSRYFYKIKFFSR
ncbi:MAG: DUF1211 domain-containing protein [Methanobacteriaceae archaeon]|jgi:uncharacterized membrane protein|nr:DUF1211 domain-containing protein [Methanobacteriaceae archaeon]